MSQIKSLKTVATKDYTMDEYKKKFNEMCINKLKTTKFNKWGLEREYVNRCKFRTKNSNDIKYKLLVKAEELIDRNVGRTELKKYTKLDHITFEIESGLYEFSLIHVTVNNLADHFILETYRDKLYDLCVNLDSDDKNVNNRTLLPSIINGTINSYFIAFLSPEQLHPKRWLSLVTRQHMREAEANDFQTTDIYKCAKCGERKFKITQLQLRGADESTSVFATCMVCYHTFIK